jgi:hypothetical protein
MRPLNLCTGVSVLPEAECSIAVSSPSRPQEMTPLAGTGAGPFAGHRVLALGAISLFSIVLDAGVVADQTLGRRAVILLPPPGRRTSLNGLFTAGFFIGGRSRGGSDGAGLDSWGLVGDLRGGSRVRPSRR